MVCDDVWWAHRLWCSDQSHSLVGDCSLSISSDANVPFHLSGLDTVQTESSAAFSLGCRMTVFYWLSYNRPKNCQNSFETVCVLPRDKLAFEWFGQLNEVVPSEVICPLFDEGVSDQWRCVSGIKVFQSVVEVHYLLSWWQQGVFLSPHGTLN